MEDLIDALTTTEQDAPAPAPSAPPERTIRMYGHDFTPEQFDRYLNTPTFTGKSDIPWERRITYGQQAQIDEAQAVQARQAQAAAIFQAIKGLDPQLQSFMLGKLGYAGAPKIAPKADQTLGNQLALAQFQQSLRAPEQAIQHGFRQEGLNLSQAQLQALADQRAISNQAQQRGLDIRESAVRQPMVKFDLAQKLIEKMANEGATPEQIQTAAQGMGYQVAGQHPSGNYLPWKPSFYPTLAQGVSGPGATAAAAPAPGEEGRKLTPQIAVAFLQAAKGDRTKAKAMATANGFTE